MSYALAIDALHDVIKAVTGITAATIGEPSSVQVVPFIYSELEGFDSDEMNDVKQFTYRSLHRLCLSWQNQQVAEALLAGYVNTIPAAVDADSRLGGAVRNAEIVNGSANWVTIDGTEYRSMEFHSEIIEVLPYG